MVETTMKVYDRYNRHIITVEPSAVGSEVIISWKTTTTCRSAYSERIVAFLDVNAALTLAGMLKNTANKASSNKTVNAKETKKIAKLKKQLQITQDNNYKRNIELDALHIVWCDGGCDYGIHRYNTEKGPLTEEIVSAAERNTKRMRSWLQNYNFRQTYMTPIRWAKKKLNEI